ncbi:MAG: RHS repeat-associated core domain-containing protein [Rudanella sp.]|nr:RHS repeat-associated core domain-containing protein [Rudanella sp.]
MKKQFTLLAVSVLFLIVGSVIAQVTPSPTTNYVIEQTPRSALDSLNLLTPYSDAPATVSYFDGLGRPLQTVQVRQAGDAGTDVVTGAITYDAYGRPQKTYLPLPGINNAGQLTTDVQTPAVGFYNNDQNPYGETTYETSPMARPNAQFGPGQAWRTANRPTRFSYGVALPNMVIKFQIDFTTNRIYGHPDGNTTTWASYDSTGAIRTRTLTDEQNQVVIEYTDIQGRMIRRDVQTGTQTLTTAYVYDRFERLGAVIPPKLYDWFLANGTAQTLPFYHNSDPATPFPVFRENAFLYQYDRRGRAIRKHVPAAGWTELVYDRQDRLVMSQDQQDATDINGSSPQWRFTRYDGMNRATQSGRTVAFNSADGLRADFANVTNEAFPASVALAETHYLTETHYDSYAPFSGVNFTFQSDDGTLGILWPNPMGLPTGGRVRNLETGVWYGFAQWYDFKGRVIQSQSQHHLGGTDRTDTGYRFNGEVQQTVLRHQKSAGGPLTTVATSNTYDHQGRPTQVSHTIDTAPPTVLASYTYDAIGRMQRKDLGAAGQSGPVGSQQSGLWTQPATWLGGTLPSPSAGVSINAGHTVTIPANTTVGAGNLFQAGSLVLETGSLLRLNGTNSGNSIALPQRIDYSWHIRGWLRGMNLNTSDNPDLSGGRVFAMKLGYEDAGFFDGNIGSQNWLHSRDGLNRNYTYNYDQADRLTGAAYSGGASGENFTVHGMTYDANGNLLSLSRADIDQLTYRYADISNKLLAVTDANSNTIGFADGNISGDDYEYYPDGSLKKDLNRDISLIEYNMLKLPRQITFNSGKVVQYQYDALGNKLKMNVSGGQTGLAETRDYVGVFQYLNNTLFEIAHEEGRNSPTGGYEYFHKDHLGNIRAVFGANGITQFTDYDPWGLPLWGGLSGGNSPNRDKFNGKESLTEVGPGVLDYGARLYDATIGRWGVVDPLAEVSRRWSPYVYVFNNPLRFIDPDGMIGIAPGVDAKYSNGYQDVDAYNESSSVTVNGFLKTGEGDEPIKGGGFPKGDLPSTVKQNAIIRSADSGPRYTEVEKASQLGVNMAGVVEGGVALLALPKLLKSVASILKNIDEFFTFGKALSKSPQQGVNIALGVREHLDDFAKTVSGETWKTWGGQNFQSQFLGTINDPSKKIHFNLTGPDGKMINAWKAVTEGAKGFGNGTITNWELHQLYSNPGALQRTTFYFNGGKVPSPF